MLKTCLKGLVTKLLEQVDQLDPLHSTAPTLGSSASGSPSLEGSVWEMLEGSILRPRFVKITCFVFSKLVGGVLVGLAITSYKNIYHYNDKSIKLNDNITF